MLPYLKIKLQQETAAISNFKGNERKSQGLCYSNGMMTYNPEKPGIGGLPLPGQQPKRKDVPSITKTPVYVNNNSNTLTTTNANATGGYVSSLPTWVVFDKQTLKFFCFFEESVQQSPLETKRIRKCVIEFFLEDDTIQVTEPSQENSGMNHGLLIKRHRILKDDGSNAYGVMDFNIGFDVNFYGKTFHIIGMDLFTRNALGKLGIDVPNEELEYPEDKYTTVRLRQKLFMTPTKPSKSGYDSLRKFLEFDRKVLRFYVYCDDRNTLYGEKRYFRLLFFLSDDTIEVVEDISPNAGRDPFTTFLKRQRIPKVFKNILPIGVRTNSYYTDEDIQVGDYITLFQHKFFIIGCDETTAEYYKVKHGVVFQNIEENENNIIDNFANTQQQQIGSSIPPPNGFGSDEDSLGSCFALIPKPPRKNAKKLNQFDKMILRFGAHLVNSNGSFENERNFVVTFFLADDSISVFEPPQRNSGIIGGTFMAKSKIKLSSSDDVSQSSNKDSNGNVTGSTSRYFNETDFYVGAIITLNNWKLKLNSADEFTLRYMESNPSNFPSADFKLIKSKLLQIVKSLASEMLFRFRELTNKNNNSKMTDYDTAVNIFRQFSQFNIVSDHELLTVLRHYDSEKNGEISYFEMIGDLGGAGRITPRLGGPA